jgi:N-acetylmuramoyl-L-alanine amidase
MMKKISLITLTLLLVAMSAYANTLMDKYNSAKKDLAYVEKSSNVSRKSYENVAERFYAIYDKNPTHSLADDSLHYTAQTYYRSYVRFKTRDDLLKALKYLRLLSVNYDTRLASMAYMQTADIYLESKDYPSARFTLNKMIQKFPKGEDTPAAKKKLAAIMSSLLTRKSRPHLQRLSKHQQHLFYLLICLK